MKASIRDIPLPSELESIGEFAFFESHIESIIIPSSVIEIGSGAFGSCRYLKAIYLNNEKHFKVYDGCLYNASLTSLLYIPCFKATVTLPSTLEEIRPEACGDNDYIQQINFPKSLTYIGKHAFSSCDGLTTLQFPDAMIELGEGAFRGCTNLKEINFGSNIKKIGEDAFTSCQQLDHISIKALTPPTASTNSFSNYNASLLVPRGRVYVYQENEVWGKFISIVDDENIWGTVNFIECDKKDCRISFPANIYNINGALIIPNASTDDYKSLSKGIYIINGNIIKL